MVRVLAEEKEESAAMPYQSSLSLLQLDSSPYAIFVLAIRSPVAKQKYLQRLGYFLDFVGLKDATIEERCNIVGERAKNDNNSGWLANNILRYLQIHKERVHKKEMEKKKINTSMNLDEDLLKWVDSQIAKKRFAHRTHAVEYALQKLKEKTTEAD
jgi:hypothetical protein